MISSFQFGTVLAMDKISEMSSLRTHQFQKAKSRARTLRTQGTETVKAIAQVLQLRTLRGHRGHLHEHRSKITTEDRARDQPCGTAVRRADPGTEAPRHAVRQNQ
jgi:23S rRNA maturation mini-RNase III